MRSRFTKRRRITKRIARMRRTNFRSLAKKVYSIKRRVDKTIETQMYAQGAIIDVPNIGALSVAPVGLNFANFLNWDGMFNAQGDAGGAQGQINEKMLWYSTRIWMQLTASNEPDRIEHNIFLVRPKKAMSPYWVAATNSLTLLPDIHYYNNAALTGSEHVGVANVTLNPKFFRVLARKSVVTQMDYIANPPLVPYSATTSSEIVPTGNRYKRMYFTVNHRRRLIQNSSVQIQPGVNDPNFTWKIMPSAPRVEDNVFVICYNNDRNTDAQITRLEIQARHTIGKLGQFPF